MVIKSGEMNYAGCEKTRYTHTNFVRMWPVGKDETSVLKSMCRNRMWSIFNPLKTEFLLNKNLVRTSQETHYVSATRIIWLTLFGETVAVYCENYTKHTNTLYGQNAMF
jgi:hypothetical protein